MTEVIYESKWYKGYRIDLEIGSMEVEYNTYLNDQFKFGSYGTEPVDQILGMARADIDSAIEEGEQIV